MPVELPFPVLHVDTGHNFPEVIEFRDRRIAAFRDEFGPWEPRAQRVEPSALYNGRIRRGEQIRVFSLSNWTELDVWSSSRSSSWSCRTHSTGASGGRTSATAAQPSG